MGDESLRTGHDTLDGRDDFVDRHDVAPDAVGGRAAGGGLGTADERPGGVVHVLHVVPPAVPDHVRPVEQGGLDRLCGIRGQPEVPARSVHGPRPQANAGNTVIEKVHPRVRFVALLEDAVVGHGPQYRVVVDGAGAVVVLHAVDRRGTRIDDPPDDIGVGPGRFEDVQGADHVDRGALDGVGLAHRDLKPGQVDDAGGARFADHPREVGTIGDVALDEPDPRDLFLVHDQRHAAGVFHQVVDRDIVPVVDQVLHDPRTDTTISAGEQILHGDCPLSWKTSAWKDRPETSSIVWGARAGVKRNGRPPEAVLVLDRTLSGKYIVPIPIHR